MRTILTTEHTKRSTTPRLILSIEWGGDIGTRYYADAALGSADGSSALNAEGRVGSWGNVSAAINESSTNPIGDLSVELLDADKSLLELIQEIEPQRKKAVVYQHFAGLAAGDLVPVLRGMVNHPVTWREAEAVLALDLTDISSYFDKTLGTLATRELFPGVAVGDEGKCLPLVYGSVKRAEAAHVEAGASATLWRAMLAGDMTFFADRGGENGFPENVEMDVWIDLEKMSGYWQGNTFFVTQRGLDLHLGYTTAEGKMENIIDSNLALTRDGEWSEYCIQIMGPDGKSQISKISATSKDAHSIWYMPAFEDEDGHVWTVPKYHYYHITTFVAPHAAGSKVSQNPPGGYTLIANDAPSKGIDKVECWGKISVAHPGAGGSASINADVEGWVPVDPNLYKVNLNDTTTFPSLGHACTTITFDRLPSAVDPARYTNDRIVCDIRGCDDEGDGTGDLVTNPADVIKAIAVNQMGLVDGTDLDTASFAAAKPQLAYLAFAFALAEQKRSLDLLADLAMQCRSQCVWEAGKLVLRVLPYALGAAQATLSTAGIAADSMERSHSALDDLVTEMVGHYRPDCQADELKIVNRDLDVEALYERRTQDLQLWAYQDRGDVAAVVHFWAHRRKLIYEDVVLETMLTSLALERLDVVELDWPGQFAAGRKMAVLGVDQTPGNAQGQIDTFKLSLRAPAGADICETVSQEPPDTSCGDSCVNSCQTPALLFCTGTCDGQCTSDCTASKQGCGSETDCGHVESEPPPDIPGCGWCVISDQETECGQWETLCQNCIVNVMTGIVPCVTNAEQGCATCCRTYSCQTCCRVSPASEGDCSSSIQEHQECGSCTNTVQNSCYYFVMVPCSTGMQIA